MSKDFCFKEDGEDIRFPISPSTLYMQYISILCVKQIEEDSKRWQEGVRLAGLWDEKEQHSSELLGFPFCLIYLRYWAEEAGNLGTLIHIDQKKKNLQKSLLSLDKGSRNG